jgi:hypothetical protein
MSNALATSVQRSSQRNWSPLRTLKIPPAARSLRNAHSVADASTSASVNSGRVVHAAADPGKRAGTPASLERLSG